MAKVKGKLIADCYVGGKLRKAGEEVEVSEEIAEDFFGKKEEKPKPDAKPDK